jgi:hypothetical protein
MKTRTAVRRRKNHRAYAHGSYHQFLLCPFDPQLLAIEKALSHMPMLWINTNHKYSAVYEAHTSFTLVNFFRASADKFRSSICKADERLMMKAGIALVLLATLCVMKMLLS